MRKFFLFKLTFLAFFSCQQEKEIAKATLDNHITPDEEVFQGMSLLGDSLFTKVDSSAQRDPLAKLEAAEEAYEENPSMENLIWIGRREAYLGRHDLAIRTFSKAIKEFPEAFEPLRHRGHRYISIRKFDEAIQDLNKAAALMEGTDLRIEEDGLPNALNIPLSTVQFNVWYHLGLAYYLKGEFEKALEAYKSCLAVSNNDDLQVATLDWYYMTLVKLGKKQEALQLIKKVGPKMNIIENDAYHKRLLVYKGEIKPEQLLNFDSPESAEQKLQYVTQGYGLGNYYLSLGDTTKAKNVFEQVIKTGYWSAFGYIASEMELAGLKDE